jgi:hypothetical protein
MARLNYILNGAVLDLARLVLGGILLSATACEAQKTVHMTWTQVVSPGWTACASGNYCLTGYTLYEGTSALASIPQSSTSYSFPIPSVGSHVFTLIQNGIDGSGATVQSSGNPGFVVNCWKTIWGRNCKVGKQWQ